MSKEPAGVGHALEAMGGPLDGEFLVLDAAMLVHRKVEIWYGGTHQYRTDGRGHVVYVGADIMRIPTPRKKARTTNGR